MPFNEGNELKFHYLTPLGLYPVCWECGQQFECVVVFLYPIYSDSYTANQFLFLTQGTGGKRKRTQDNEEENEEDASKKTPKNKKPVNVTPHSFPKAKQKVRTITAMSKPRPFFLFCLLRCLFLHI